MLHPTEGIKKRAACVPSRCRQHLRAPPTRRARDAHSIKERSSEESSDDPAPGFLLQKSKVRFQDKRRNFPDLPCEFSSQVGNPGSFCPIARLLPQEALDDLVLRFLFGQPEGLQFEDLLAGDLADGGLVDQGSVGVAATEPFSPMMASHSECPVQAALPVMTER